MAASTVLAKAVGAEELNVHKPGYRGLKSSGMITLVGSVRAMTVSSSFSRSTGIVRAVTTICLGETPNHTTLAKCFMNKVKIQDLERALEPLFYTWRRKRLQGEPFG